MTVRGDLVVKASTCKAVMLSCPSRIRNVQYESQWSNGAASNWPIGTIGKTSLCRILHYRVCSASILSRGFINKVAGVQQGAPHHNFSAYATASAMRGVQYVIAVYWTSIENPIGSCTGICHSNAIINMAFPRGGTLTIRINFGDRVLFAKRCPPHHSMTLWRHLGDRWFVTHKRQGVSCRCRS